MSGAVGLRAPLQVVIFPFRRGVSSLEYAIFQRSGSGWWQGLAGGGDVGETPLDAARREAFEEGQVPLSATYYKLDSVSSVPANLIAESERKHWPINMLIVPNYSFGVDCTGITIKLSHEHMAFHWVPFELADACLKLDNNRVALWELDQRIKRSLLDKA